MSKSKDKKVVKSKHNSDESHKKSKKEKKSKKDKKNKKSVSDPTVEEIYKEKTLHEHIYTVPDTYVGSVKPETRDLWVYSTENGKMEKRVMIFVPAFLKNFDEILVNARDHTVRDSSCKNIRVDIDKDTGFISVWNDGAGIPVEFHKDSKKYVPHMIFGTLLTSSNYDQVGKITGGKNGYGAKCTNIFSKEFTIETVDSKNKKKYTQKFSNNMYDCEDPVIKNVDKSVKSYTKITYLPDFERYSMKGINSDTYDLLVKRAYDLAACTSSKVKVWVNGNEVKSRKLSDYIKLYYDSSPKLIYEDVNSRWSVGAVFDKDCNFNQVSFVNGICTFRGGTHVSHVVDQIVKKITEHINSQAKYKTLKIKRSAITDNLAVYIDAVIEDPSFDSQSKETLTTKVSEFGKHKDARCNLSDDFMNKLATSGLVDEVIKFAEFKAQDELKKTDGKKTSSVLGIEKLEDAHNAGGRKSKNTRLFITEGDSAKAFALAGLAVIGKDNFGVFPVRGKFLNVKTASAKQILKNEEFSNIKKILGLRQKMHYDDVSKLRYGGIIILTDQDVDGSHIKGLLINMLETYWPSLLKIKGFIQTLNTPIVKVWKKSDKKKEKAQSFYTLSAYEQFVKKKTEATGKENIKNWEIKYYKGLGTSDAKEAKESFRDFYNKIISFVEDNNTESDSESDELKTKDIKIKSKNKSKSDDSDNEDDEFSDEETVSDTGDDDESIQNVLKDTTTNAIGLAFDKKRADDRKVWLSSYDKDDILEFNDGNQNVTYEEFINKDLKHFSNYDNLRSIPNMMDGFKPSQRKIMFACFKRGRNAGEIKVAQLAGYVAQHTEYHHNEDSLKGTIIGLAQNYVGSNNINLLTPSGNFGYRNLAGKDHASARYIFTKLENITEKIFREEDEFILKYINEDGHIIEPIYYAPIIPTVLINGSDGIGTGYSSKLCTFNPKDIIKNIRRLLNGEVVEPMTPWFKGFNGTVEKESERRFINTGVYEIIDGKTVHITEIPRDISITAYKKFLESKLPANKDDKKAKLEHVKSDSLNHKVDFTVKFRGNELKKLIKSGEDKLIAFLKLKSNITLTNIHFYDKDYKLVKYDFPEDVLEEFYLNRFKMYEERINYMIEKLQNQFNIIDYKIKYIENVIDETIVVKGHTKNQLLERIEELEYPKLSNDHTTPEEQRSYKYLTDMYLTSLTTDKIEELKEERKKRKKEYDDYKNTSTEDRWRKELDELEKVYDKWLVESLEALNDDDEDFDPDEDPKKKKGKGKGKKKNVKKVKKNTNESSKKKTKKDK
jgi:DNA topoisomerase-2